MHTIYHIVHRASGSTIDMAKCTTSEQIELMRNVYARLYPSRNYNHFTKVVHS